jgi:hypothetical protein
VNKPEDKLWDRIEQLSIDPPGVSLSFEKRLARENGWSEHHARLVFGEYKRFVYLVATTGKELTPSDAVDQAWHLHLAYTHSYWRDLCQGILGFELHHNPTRGGTSEQLRFSRQYTETLQLYRNSFDEDAPQTVWPSPEKRFENPGRFERVNRSGFWLVRKPGALSQSLFATTLMSLPLVACTDSLEGRGTLFWVKVAIGIWAVYMFIKFVNWLGPGGGRGGGGSGCGAGCGGCGGC